MSYKILHILLAVLVISMGTAYAQSLISVQTDKDSYNEGDQIIISGKVNTVIGETPIILQIFRDGTFIDLAQKSVAQDGSYSAIVASGGQLWNKQGTYIVRALYGEVSISEAQFEYTPKAAITQKTANFEVDASSRGTFDVEYTIKGGTVKDMVIDSDNFALDVTIESTNRGSISLDLPRELMGAEKPDSKDDKFIILIDDIPIEYEEPAEHSDSRKVTINFEQGDSNIKIIGTYIVPEFGVIMMILVIGILITILASKNKLQMKI